MIELKNVSVIFEQKKQSLTAVDQVSLTIEKADIFGIVGYSGAGKSTLVRVINLLQRPTDGQVIVNNEELTQFSAKELRKKRKQIGMIFQHFNLMKNRTIFQNVEYALKYSGIKKGERQRKVTELLELVGLAEKAHSYPAQLSGGQKQRVAIARALASDPEILLCDEATSALDPKTTLQILDLLKTLNQKLGLTIVLITHEMQVVKEICNKVAVMEEGRVIEHGSVLQIFSRPKQDLTKDFIRTATHVDQALATIATQPNFANLHVDESLVELSYVGSTTNEAIIAQVYSQYNVVTNILFGNVDILQEESLGRLIVTFRGEPKDQHATVAFLEKKGVDVTAIKGPLTHPLVLVNGGEVDATAS
ncbi:MAG: methionine ABC transporter ATP-binding protein [Enterococcus sp.]